VMLQVFFIDWIERLEKYITTNGEYVEWFKTKIAGEKIFIRTVSTFSPRGGTPCILHYIILHYIRHIRMS
jgi:hypothetical protein